MLFCRISRIVVIKNLNRVWGAILFFLTVLFFNTSYADQSVMLGWSASTDTKVIGYHAYCGTISGIYTDKIDAETNTSVKISGLQEGQTYYFAVTAYGTNNAESSFSQEIAFLVPGILRLAQNTNSGSFNMKFPVAPNHWYEIQASIDLKSWTTIDQTAVVTSNNWVQFSDSQAGQFSKRFYRLILH